MQYVIGYIQEDDQHFIQLTPVDKYGEPKGEPMREAGFKVNGKLYPLPSGQVVLEQGKAPDDSKTSNSKSTKPDPDKE